MNAPRVGIHTDAEVRATPSEPDERLALESDRPPSPPHDDATSTSPACITPDTRACPTSPPLLHSAIFRRKIILDDGSEREHELLPSEALEAPTTEHICSTTAGHNDGQNDQGGGAIAGFDNVGACVDAAPQSKKPEEGDAPGSDPLPMICVKSTEDMLNWARHACKVLLAYKEGGDEATQVWPNALHRCRAAFQNTTYSTAFSGVDSAGTSLEEIRLAMTAELETEIKPMRHVAAIEWYGESQAELALHPSPPECLFSDMSSFFCEGVQAALKDITASGACVNLATLLPLIRTGRAVRRYAPCLRHPEGTCEHSRAKLHIAGTPCVDYSAFGSHAGDAGPTSQHFAAWAALRLLLEDLVIIHENVPSFSAEVLKDIFGAKYVIETIILDPQQLGWPVVRKRRYTVLWSRLGFSQPASVCSSERVVTLRFALLVVISSVIVVQRVDPTSFSCKRNSRHRQLINGVHASLNHVIHLFYRLCLLTWHSFLVASEHEVREDLAWARRRPGSMGCTCDVSFDKNTCDLSEKEFRLGLTRTEVKALDDYIEQHPGLCYCVGQNPEKRLMISSTTHWQTLIKNVHILWCHPQQRWATPNEILQAQGFRTYDEKLFVCSFQRQRTRQRSAVAGQAGNAMHVNAVGVIATYVLSFLRRPDCSQLCMAIL